MTESEEFRAFCADQTGRLSKFKAFGFLETPAKRDYRRWLERKCQTRERVSRVMDAADLRDEMPTIATLNRIFTELYPAALSEPNLDCPRCSGTGWEIIRRGGAEGTIRCPAGCVVPEFDPSRTLKSPAGAQDLRRENSAFAAELARDLAGSLIPKPIHAATSEEIESIKLEQERNRREVA